MVLTINSDCFPKQQQPVGVTVKETVRGKRNCWGRGVRDYIWGQQETISPVLKVPRQCPLVFLV
jgi:hypothetical protein